MVKQKKPAKNTSAANASAKNPEPSSKTGVAASASDLKQQQRLLNVFSEAFGDLIAAENFTDNLQEIKQALFQRDFAAAFGKEEYLEAYAARWSPTRALCYASVLSSIRDHLERSALDEESTLLRQDEPQNSSEPVNVGSESHEIASSTKPPRSLEVLSIGGCAAEHVAFASFISDSDVSGRLKLVDSAPWSQVVSLLQTRLVTPPQLSKFASTAIKASNKAMVESSQFTVDFKRCDVLQLARGELAELLGSQTLLVTIFFTLNELYTEGGIGKTTKFLGNLGQSLPDKSLLLVVDSPGSYSEATVGKTKKKYPMQWLLDHTLLETDMEGCKWEKLESSDSVWFRLPEGLSYPMQLENMRYQLHLYQIERR